MGMESSIYIFSNLQNLWVQGKLLNMVSDPGQFYPDPDPGVWGTHLNKEMYDIIAFVYLYTYFFSIT